MVMLAKVEGDIWEGLRLLDALFNARGIVIYVGLIAWSLASCICILSGAKCRKGRKMIKATGFAVDQQCVKGEGLILHYRSNENPIVQISTITAINLRNTFIKDISILQEKLFLLLK